MPHIHTAPGEHDHTVSAFIINPVEQKVLLHIHKIVGKWLQPGGHIETSESPWETLTHELVEETGYEIYRLTLLQYVPHIPGLQETVQPLPLVTRTHAYTPDFDHTHIDSAYGFLTTENPTLPLAPGESEVFNWFTIEDLQNLPENQIPPDTRTIAIWLLKNWETLTQIDTKTFN